MHGIRAGEFKVDAGRQSGFSNHGVKTFQHGADKIQCILQSSIPLIASESTVQEMFFTKEMERILLALVDGHY
jgi:hypothetical protein